MEFVQVGNRMLNLRNIAYITFIGGAGGAGWTSAVVVFVGLAARDGGPLYLELEERDAETLRGLLTPR